MTITSMNSNSHPSSLRILLILILCTLPISQTMANVQLRLKPDKNSGESIVQGYGSCTIANAITYINDNGLEGNSFRIMLSQDETIESTMNIEPKKALTVLFRSSSNGSTYTISFSGDNSSNHCMLNVNAPDSYVTIEEGITLDANRSQNGTSLSDNFMTVALVNAGKLTVKGTIKGGNAIGQTEYGGGVTVLSGGELEMNGGTITGNCASHGGGIYCKEGIFNKNEIDTPLPSTISDNKCYASSGDYPIEAQGAGIYYYYDDKWNTSNIKNYTISGNTIDSENGKGAGIYAKGHWQGSFDKDYRFNLKIIDSTISGNECTNGIYAQGGGLYLDEVKCTIKNTTIGGDTENAGNEAAEGGAIFMEGAAYLIINESTNIFNNNKARTMGGGIKVEGDKYNKARFSLSNVYFTNNSATNNTNSGQGGAIYVYRSEENSELNGCFFTSNVASEGGAIYAIKDNNNIDTHFSISGNTTFSNNTESEETSGFDLFIYQFNELTAPDVHTVLLSGSINFSQNDTKDNSDITIKGKGVLSQNGSLTINNNPHVRLNDNVKAGRDILIDYSDNNVTDQKLPFQLSLAEEYQRGDNSYIYGYKAAYNANGRDDGNTSSTRAIELTPQVGKLTIQCTGLKKDDSAVFTVTPSGQSNPLYSIQLTGTDDNGTAVTKTISYLTADTYTVTLKSWDWAYTNPQETTKNCTVSVNDTATASFEVTCKESTGVAHAEHGVDSTN